MYEYCVSMSIRGFFFIRVDTAQESHNEFKHQVKPNSLQASSK